MPSPNKGPKSPGSSDSSSNSSAPVPPPPPPPPTPKVDAGPKPPQFGLKPVVHPDSDREINYPPLSLEKGDQDALAAKRYRIGDGWKTGGFGMIYKAYQDFQGSESKGETNLVAKVIEIKDLAPNYWQVGQLKEMKNRDKDKDSFLLPVWEVMMIKKPDRLLIIMALAEENLEEFLFNFTPFVPKKIVAQYFWQLNKGLNYLHSHKLAHRNLKPRNLLILPVGKEMRLSDCNLSRRTFAVQHPESVNTFEKWHDTFAWWAPEVFGEKSDYCPMAADMWSASCILYFMLWKTWPFQSSKMDKAELLDKQKQYKLSLVKRTEPDNEAGQGDICEAQKLMARLWSQNPAKRPTSKQIITDTGNVARWSHWWPTATPGAAIWHDAFHPK